MYKLANVLKSIGAHGVTWKAPCVSSIYLKKKKLNSPVQSWQAILCCGPVQPWRPGASSISCAASELHLELHRELSASYRPLGALLSYTIHTCTEQSADSYDTDTLCHNLLAIIYTHTALGPVYSIAMQHCSTPKNLFPSTTNTDTSQKSPEQRREQHLSRMCSSSGFWCLGVGDPLGLHVLQVSVQAPAVLLQYPCVSPTAQKKQPVRTHTQDRHPPKAFSLLENLQRQWLQQFPA